MERVIIFVKKMIDEVQQSQDEKWWNEIKLNEREKFDKRRLSKPNEFQHLHCTLNEVSVVKEWQRNLKRFATRRCIICFLRFNFLNANRSVRLTAFVWSAILWKKCERKQTKNVDSNEPKEVAFVIGRHNKFIFGWFKMKRVLMNSPTTLCLILAATNEPSST